MSWYTSAELSGKAGLPGTVAGIIKRANRDGWQSRKRAGRGGGNEYHIDSLPPETQRALRISHARKVVSELPTKGLSHSERQQSLAEYRRLPQHVKNQIDARLALMDAAREFQLAAGLPKSKAYAEFSKAYKADDINVEPWVRDAQPNCSRPALFAWEKRLREHGIASVAGDKGTARRGKGTIDSQPELANYIEAMLVAHPHIKSTVLVKALRTEFYGQAVTLPSERALCRWIASYKIKNAQLFTAVTNPDQWKNKYMAAFGDASEAATGLNQLWEFDSTPADLMLADGRHSLLGVIDVYSRRVKFIVMPTSDSKGVAKVIRRAILDWGVPTIAKTDNGADYKSKWIKTTFKSLGIEQQFCPPFQGWKKPHIERVFRTFAHDLAELLPGFIGHNVSERQAIEARNSFSDRLFKKDQLIEAKLTAAELQTFCDQWLEYEYHTRKHGELGCSPNDMVTQYPGAVKTIDDERLLDVLLSQPAGGRTITKKGIHLNACTYVHAELAAHIGETVQVFYDEADIGRIYVYSAEGDFICTAEDPAISGISREELAAQAKSIQKEAIQEERRRLKAEARKLTKRDIAQQILTQRAEQERAEKVTDFPRPQVQHTSAGIDAAKDALNSERHEQQLPSWFNPDLELPEQPVVPEPRGQVITPEFKTPESKTSEAGFKAPDDIEEGYYLAEEVARKIANKTATDEEENWHRIYITSSKYRTGKALYANAVGQ